MEKEKLWEGVLAEIELIISPANFTTWFQNTNIANKDDGVIFINVPNTFAKEWLFNKYHKLITKSLRGIDPNVRSVEYIILPQNSNNPQKAQQTVHKESDNQLEFNELYINSEDNLNPRYTFDSFIIGSFNELAYAAAETVSKNLGSQYNPLFIYGGTGLGKTHLLQAIGNKLKETNSNANIKYITSEKFTSDLIESIRSNTIYNFKEKYRQCNLLIIDDIQFFSGKQKTQEEFFHIFNSLYESNKQVVFSCDKPPKHIEGLEERLRSRFEGGMMVDVSKPDFESRLAILKSKLETKNFTLSNEIVEYIASVIKDSIRELEGALNIIIGEAKVKNREITIQEIKDILKKNIKPYKTVTINTIIKTIADFYNIEEKFIFGKTRKKEYVTPRQIAMYLLREDFNSSFPYIGKKFGGRDHTTVIYSYEKILNDIPKNERLNQEITQIREILYKD